MWVAAAPIQSYRYYTKTMIIFDTIECQFDDIVLIIILIKK